MDGSTRFEMPASDESLLLEDLEAVRRFLKGYVRRRGVASHLTEEAVEEGVFKAFLKAHLWRGEAKRRTYLIAVGKNAVLDFLDRQITREKLCNWAYATAEAVIKRLRGNRVIKAATLSDLDGRKDSNKAWRMEHSM